MQSHRFPLAPAVLALALLSACGGGGGDEPAASNTASAAAPATPAAPSNPSTPAVPPAGSTAVDSTCGLANFEADALRLINQYRAAGATCGAHGSFAPATALSRNPLLVDAAYGHSRDMADNNYFSHTSLDGRTMRKRIEAAGYTWSLIGENIAAGHDSVETVVAGWMASEGHCANLMDPRFTEFGLACARNASSDYRIYWTQNLGRP